MKYIKEYLETVVKIKPLGELTTKDDELNGMSGEMVYIDGKCADIFISHADYANWLESKYEQKKCCGEVDDIALQQQLQIWFDKGKCSGRDEVIFHPEIYGLQKQGEHKPADKVKPKFKVGDWLASDYNNVAYIESISETKYNLQCKDGYHEKISIDYIDRCWHLWTIQDAKDGDVLFQDLMDGKTFIYNGINPDMAILYSFIISNDGKDVLPYHIGKPNIGIGNIEENKNIIHPATKEQRELLFQKMHEAGYTFDFEKKELKKLKFKVGDEIITENEESLTITRIDEDGYWSNDLFICGFDDSAEWELVEQKPYGQRRECLDCQFNYAGECKGSCAMKRNELESTWSEEDEEHLNSIISDIKTDMGAYPRSQEVIDIYNDDISFLKSLRDRVQPQQKQEWSEEDEIKIKSIIAFLKSPSLCAMDGNKGIIDANIKYLKLLKDRYTWKPSDEQMDYLRRAINYYPFEPDYLEGLYEDLKKLKRE